MDILRFDVDAEYMMRSWSRFSSAPEGIISYQTAQPSLGEREELLEGTSDHPLGCKG
jgi:hypothetical protein